MSDTYNRKIEIRKGREMERQALRVAKELVSRYSSCNDMKKQMPVIRDIRDAIIQSRPKDVQKEQPEAQTDVWYETLSKLLLGGLFGKTKSFAKLLDKGPHKFF